VLHDVMGNDSYGDCVFAALNHLAGVATGNAGALWHPTTEQVLADYATVTGFNPADPSTDNGTNEVDALNFYVEHGFANGTRALGWLDVNATDKLEVKSTISLFEHALPCLELPDAYVHPYPSGDGFVWGVGTPNPNQGHAIIIVGYDDARGVLICTWGMLGWLTWDALAALCVASAGGSLSILLTPDMLIKGSMKAGNGFAWQDLVAAFDSMGGHVPVPPGPSPDPLPPGPPTLASAQAWVDQAIDADHHFLYTKQSAKTLVNAALLARWSA